MIRIVPKSVWMALRYSSPRPVRLLLTICAVAAGLGFFFIPERADFMVRYPPLFLILPSQIWGAIFCLCAFAMFWRVVDSKPRIGWSRLINGAMFCVWMSFASANLWALGFFTPDLASLFGLAIAAAWATLRTDLTSGDRADA